MRAALTLTRLLARPETAARLTAAEWQAVLTVATAERLDATLAHRLQSATIPGPVAAILCNAAAETAHSQRFARWECDRIALALADSSAPVVLLKGAALLLAGSSAAAGRSIGDVDLLVPRDALDEVESRLLDAGWEWAKPDPYDDAYYRRWMHELPPLIHKTRNSAVDVHHTILPLTARPTPDPAAILARAHRVEGSVLLVPAPTDLLIHAAAHLIADGELEGGLRNLWDIDRLAREHDEPEFWTSLMQHASEHKLREPVRRALRLARRLYGTPVPETVGGADRPSDALFVRRLLARDGWGRSGRSLTRLAFTARGHTLRMPPRLLVPHLWRKWRRRSPSGGRS